jgi:hypothetical protein
MCDIKGSIYFKGNEKLTINGLHGVLAFYRFLYLGVFRIMDHYTVLHFGLRIECEIQKKLYGRPL